MKYIKKREELFEKLVYSDVSSLVDMYGKDLIDIYNTGYDMNVMLCLR